MSFFPRVSRKAMVACIGISLLVTTFTGYYPEHGGAPGSSGAGYGLPINWRLKRWRQAIPEYELIHLADGGVEARLVPYFASGATRTLYRPMVFVLDVVFWSVLAVSAICILNSLREHRFK